MRICLTTLFLLLLAGCGSSPKTHFYTLSTVPGATGRRSASTAIQVSAVHVPPSLDRQQMVSMSGTNSVEISETNRWSAPFDEMVRNVLAQNLAARLSPNRVILPEAPAPPRTASLVVTIAKFAPDASGLVRLQGSWTVLSDESGAPITHRNFNLTAGPATTADSGAAAMSEVLGRLANQIAAAL
jgi:uncharacterized lipoprotein YmbA